LFLLFFTFVKLEAQTDSISFKKPIPYPGWTFIVPGATHFYSGHIMRGILFSGIEVGGITAGLLADKKLQPQTSTPYYNFPLMLGMQAYNIDKTDWLANRLALIKYYQPDFKYDVISFNDMLKAPFLPKNFFTPITGGFVLVALAELYLSGRNVDYTYKNINQMYFVNRYINRNPAMAFYSATSLATAYGAGVAEEYYFRNGILPIYDYRFGSKKGLLLSSAFFGAAHFTNLLMNSNPDYQGTLIQVLEATLAGYFLGRDVQKRGYNIGPAIAAHTWYDFTLMLGSFLIDPKNNYLGVDIQFKM
jgi:membrane protease YdiL (CAAX protease family)